MVAIEDRQRKSSLYVTGVTNRENGNQVTK